MVDSEATEWVKSQLRFFGVMLLIIVAVCVVGVIFVCKGLRDSLKQMKKPIIKTKIVDVQEQYRTYVKGATTRMLVGGLLGGGLGALCGALTAKEKTVPVGMKVAFLVYYQDGTKDICWAEKGSPMFKTYLDKIDADSLDDVVVEEE